MNRERELHFSNTRVFLLEEVRRNIDVSSARDFGEIRYLFEANDRRSSVFDSENFIRDVRSALAARQFDPSVDCFCIAGSMINVALATIALVTYVAELEMNTVNLLMFDSVVGKYAMRSMELDLSPIGDSEHARTGS